MITKIIEDVKVIMTADLNMEQMQKLEIVMLKVLHDYDVSKKNTEIVVYDDSGMRLLQKFIAVRQLDGLSKKSLEQYYAESRRLLECVGKHPKDITTDDVRYYLYNSKVSKKTINNKIRYINAFFKWLENEDYITRNPMNRIHSVKEDKIIKKPYTDQQREELKTNAKNIRDVAIMEVLYSTGARISELCRMNRTDVVDGECIVFGKGSKERKVYFTDTSIYYLRKYLDSRTDDNEALFVTLDKPHTRLSDKAVESMLRKLGSRCGIEKVHPHRFRRTLATNSLNRGMPLQEVKEMLGHERIDTTMLYCKVSEENVKNSHKKCS